MGLNVPHLCIGVSLGKFQKYCPSLLTIIMSCSSLWLDFYFPRNDYDQMEMGPANGAAGKEAWWAGHFRHRRPWEAEYQRWHFWFSLHTLMLDDQLVPVNEKSSMQWSMLFHLDPASTEEFTILSRSATPMVNLFKHYRCNVAQHVHFQWPTKTQTWESHARSVGAAQLVARTAQGVVRGGRKRNLRMKLP